MFSLELAQPLPLPPPMPQLELGMEQIKMLGALTTWYCNPDANYAIERMATARPEMYGLNPDQVAEEGLVDAVRSALSAIWEWICSIFNWIVKTIRSLFVSEQNKARDAGNREVRIVFGDQLANSSPSQPAPPPVNPIPQPTKEELKQAVAEIRETKAAAPGPTRIVRPIRVELDLNNIVGWAVHTDLLQQLLEFCVSSVKTMGVALNHISLGRLDKARTDPSVLRDMITQMDSAYKAIITDHTEPKGRFFEYHLDSQGNQFEPKDGQVLYPSSDLTGVRNELDRLRKTRDDATTNPYLVKTTLASCFALNDSSAGGEHAKIDAELAALAEGAEKAKLMDFFVHRFDKRYEDVPGAYMLGPSLVPFTNAAHMVARTLVDLHTVMVQERACTDLLIAAVQSR